MVALHKFKFVIIAKSFNRKTRNNITRNGYIYIRRGRRKSNNRRFFAIDFNFDI